MVHLKSDLGDETTLLTAKDITSPANVEVAHGDVETAAQVREFLDGLEAFAGFVGKQ